MLSPGLTPHTEAKPPVTLASGLSVGARPASGPGGWLSTAASDPIQWSFRLMGSFLIACADHGPAEHLRVPPADLSVKPLPLQCSVLKTLVALGSPESQLPLLNAGACGLCTLCLHRGRGLSRQSAEAIL